VILLVCKACGTQHEILVAHEYRGEQDIIRYRVKIVAVPSRARIETMIALRKRLDLSAAEAKYSLGGLPLVFAESVSKEGAFRLTRPLVEAGVEVVIEECSREQNPYYYAEPFRTDMLTAASGPCHAELDEHELHPRVDKEVPGPRVGARGNVDLERQPCGYCKTEGSLVGEHAALECCPHCGGPAPKETGGWVT